MSIKKCMMDSVNAAGLKLGKDDLDALEKELGRRMREVRRRSKADATKAIILQSDAWKMAGDELAEDISRIAAIEQRNAVMNLRIEMEVLDYVRTHFKDEPWVGVQAWLVGTQKDKPGARQSAGLEQYMLTEYYLEGFHSELVQRDLWDLFADDRLALDITRALWTRTEDGGIGVPPKGTPKQAIEIAEVLHKWQEISRNNKNAKGADVAFLPGYVVRQGHNSYEILTKGGPNGETYIADLKQWLSPETLDRTDVDAFLMEVYKGNAKGHHLRVEDAIPTGFKGFANVAKRLSQRRVLHFKDADSWFAYNEKYGNGSLREAVFNGFVLDARATGLMGVMGTNPRDTFTKVTQQLLKETPPGKLHDKLEAKVKGELSHFLAEVTGEDRIPVNQMQASIMSSIRGMMNLSRMGGALLSQFGDLPLWASELRAQGADENMLTLLAESVEGIFEGRGTREKQELAGMLGVPDDLAWGNITHRFSISEGFSNVPGAISKGQQLLFKYGGMTGWTDRQRAKAIFAMAWRLAFNKDRAWGKLHPDLSRTLGLFKIDETDWNVIRQSAVRKVDKRNYVTPEAIENLSDDAVVPLLRGADATPGRLAAAREELAMKYRRYLADRSTFAAITPDARQRAFVHRGTQPGTIEGDFFRQIGQFKAFPLSVIQKPLARDYYRTGGSLANTSTVLAIAQLFVMTTAVGYVSMSAKDLAKGRKPRNPLDWKTLAAAAAQGGGLGIYGDFLFGEMRTRHGSGFLGTVAGPTGGLIQDLFDLYGRVKAGEDAAGRAFRVLINNIPFQNVFYTKLALDYLILWRIQEAINPGAMRRLERTIERENDQTFWLSPSSSVQSAPGVQNFVGSLR